jgi:acyl-coenzyme A thioesterase PaaI-like protein
MVHHDLCFGCGQANLFGLQLELERDDSGGVEGRFFVKQDHQGPPGSAHGGVVASALHEAMALLVPGAGGSALSGRLEVELIAPARVGGFVRVAALIEKAEGRRIHASATAIDDETGASIGRARCAFEHLSSEEGG